MKREEALRKMIAPGDKRATKWRQGVIQIHVTRACDKSCWSCTQGSNLGGKTTFMTPDQFEQAVLSLKGYYGVVGVFGGNPALSPHFKDYCEILKRHVPFEQRGLWCNNPAGKGRLMAETFNPSVSNLNVHLDEEAYREFKRDWPGCHPVGLHQDSRHSPPFVAMKDVLKRKCECVDQIVKEWNDAWEQGDSEKVARLEATEPVSCDKCNNTRYVYDEEKAWELISNCDINKYWSALIGVFRGELRAWFCEIAGAQAMLHQYEEDYPDTGIDPTVDYEYYAAPGDKLETVVGKWWQMGMLNFAHQVDKHCHDCGVPLRGYGQLSQSTEDGEHEQCSATHEGIYKPKRKGREVQVVTDLVQLGVGKLTKMTDYIGNGSR